MGNSPDSVKHLVDARDMTEMSDISDRVPSPDRKVFLSGDYKEEQLRLEFLNGHCLTVRRSDLASAAPVGQRGAWTWLDCPCLTVRRSDFGVCTSLSPFFTALGWDMDNKQGLSEFSDIANSVHSSWFTVPGTEDRKPGTKDREPGTDEVIRLTAGHQAKVEEKPEVRKAGLTAVGVEAILILQK
jgi:hypothetical protein